MDPSFKSDTFKNIQLMAFFFTQTLDFIATPQALEERIPVELFTIRKMIAQKFPQSPSKLSFLVRHVEAMRNTPKYAIELHSDQNPCSSIDGFEITKQAEKF